MMKIALSRLLTLVVMMFLPTLAGCNDNSKQRDARASSPKTTNARDSIPAPGTRVSLTLTGYNYTNHYIDQFTVNGNGGGNIFVSGPNTGGGGSACCVNYMIGIDSWKFPVRWQIGGCSFNTSKYKDGRESSEIYHFFKEEEVSVDPKIPDRPAYLEIHFYPDGHVEAAITEHSSPPRLQLSKDREIKPSYRQCPNDKRPEE
jgi:hypothetical protein